MTIFPALIPSTRTYSPGEYPHTPHPLLSGSEIRVRHSNTVLGVRLRLTFQAVSSADLLAVRNHYNGRRGGFLPFAIPDELLSGVTTPADFTPAGHQWVYAARPRVVDVPIAGPTPTNRHDLVVELETVPPENTIVGGARIIVRASLRAGSAERGAFLEAFASLEAGAASAVNEIDALGAFITVDASLTAGSANAVADTDPSFSSVSMLLPLNGTNGSTAFTDFSSNALTVTQTGGAAISTAASLFGTGVLRLEAANDERLNLPSNTVLSLDGDFTIEFALNTLSDRGGLISFSGVANRMMLNQTSTVPNAHRLYLMNAGVEIFDNVNIGLAGSTWHWIALTRSGSTLRLFGGGTLYATATNTSTFVLTAIGRQSSGPYTTPDAYFAQIRVTKGVARYTASYTVPAAAFPTS